jgi:hypothetical protein
VKKLACQKIHCTCETDHDRNGEHQKAGSGSNTSDLKSTGVQFDWDNSYADCCISWSFHVTSNTLFTILWSFIVTYSLESLTLLLHNCKQTRSRGDGYCHFRSTFCSYCSLPSPVFWTHLTDDDRGCCFWLPFSVLQSYRKSSALPPTQCSFLCLIVNVQMTTTQSQHPDGSSASLCATPGDKKFQPPQ